MTDNERDTNAGGKPAQPDSKAATTPANPPPEAKREAPTAKPAATSKPDPASPATGGGGGGGSTPPPTTPPPQKSGGGKGLAAFALLLALGALGASGYLWWQLQEAQQERPDPEAQMAQVREQLQQARSEIAQERDQVLEDVRQQVQEALGQSESLSETFQGEAQSVREALSSETETLRGETETLRSQLQTVRTEAQTLAGENETLRTRMRNLGNQLEELRDDLNNLQQVTTGASDEQIAELSRLASRIENLQLSQRGLLNNLEAVREVASKGGDVNALPLSEVEYLLRVASHKLKLQKDVDTALDALRLADRRLEQVNEPEFNRVESMIRENIAALRGVDVPDYSALAHRIAEMEQKVMELPVEMEIQVAQQREQVKPRVENEGVISLENENPWYEQMGTAIWDQFKDIVVVRHERMGGPPLIAVEEEYFLRQNLRLELEAARLGLLREDAVSYQDSLAKAQEWLTTYFDTDTETVANFAQEIEDLEQVQFNPYIPDITGTLNAFRDVMEIREPVRSVMPSAEAATREAGRQAQAGSDEETVVEAAMEAAGGETGEEASQ